MARHDWKTPFLNALREGHTVSFAAKLAGVNRQLHPSFGTGED